LQLSMSRELGMRVNVQGTFNVLDFAQRLTNLRCVRKREREWTWWAHTGGGNASPSIN
jgi:hypothetical protein